MASLPIIANAYLMFQQLNSSVGELHVMGTRMCILDATPVTSVTNLANRYAQKYANDLMPFMGVDFSMGPTVVTPLDGISSSTTVFTPNVGTVGGHTTGNGLPDSIAFGVTWQTGLRGRSRRGRSYFPGVKSDQLTQVELRALTVAAQTAVQTGCTSFITDLNATGTGKQTLQVLSKKLGGAFLVTTARANVNAVSQRRRFERVARH